MPAVDKSGDGVIDFEEFKSIGDYLSHQFARVRVGFFFFVLFTFVFFNLMLQQLNESSFFQKDEDEANANDNHMGLDLNDIANQVIFQNVVEEAMVVKESGHTKYVGSQIIFYGKTFSQL